jgi:hypothetical protein
MRLLNTGNVGIGTSSPSQKLEVAGTIKSTATGASFLASGTTASARYAQIVNDGSVNGVLFGTEGTTAGGILTGTSSYSGIISQTGNLDLALGTFGVARLIITGAGNVGIGTSSPVAKLQIKGSGTSGQVTASFILENSSSSTAGMDITGTAGASRWRFLYGGGPSTGTNTLSEAINILTEGASAGFVGIGTPSPSTKLTIYDATTPQLTFNNGTSTFIVGNNAGGNNKILYGTGAYPMIFYTNAVEAMRIPSAGGIQSVTTISVGDATPSTSGAGITFPATQSASSNANTLDDYEEGTWSASAITSVNNTGASFSEGRYTKIGNIVHIQGKFTLTVTSANTLTYVIMASPLTPLYSTSGTAMDNSSLVSGTMQITDAGNAYAFFAASASLPSGATVFYVNAQYQV